MEITKLDKEDVLSFVEAYIGFVMRSQMTEEARDSLEKVKQFIKSIKGCEENKNE